MPANIDPIFTKVGQIEWSGTLTTGNTTKDGTSGTTLLFTADSTNGSFVRSVMCKSAGTTGGPTVLRLFVNNGSTTGTAANNSMIREVTLPSITNSETAAQVDIEVPVNMALPPGYRLYAVLGTTVTGGWHVTAIGGKY